ncbi:dynein regulatory complex subunit 7 [Salarias fasciatus]|uniref:dynein regulatory complex subunit 7 n=1 Tax=Salarias fasciatus TaxID=181472 RepID=UPI001176542B|nr:dynein regulatory complex subunit 7-like [Salarias fasciatus]
MSSVLTPTGRQRWMQIVMMEVEETEEEKLTCNSTVAEQLLDSYRMNSAVELRLLTLADRFQRQFSILHPDRRPLLLSPANECGVQKFVCTTLRPSSSSRVELHTWQGCAAFVADVLMLEPLEPPTELPRSLSSPSSVLQRQTASCFEAAALLCSLLLGADYDAYCVSGYADREMCLLDRSREDCPLLDGPQQNRPLEDAEAEISEQKQQKCKYGLRPEREPESRYLRRLEESKKQEEEAVLQDQKLQQHERQPPPDALHGLRVHGWVLVLSGSRGVQENFFIDPLSGRSFPTHSRRFLGIESVWNQSNYYTNMQDCREGCREMIFNLEDLEFWEPLLFEAVSRRQLLAEAQMREMTGATEETAEELQIRVVDMPTSWVGRINPTELQHCWPGGQKQTLYWKSKLERFAPRLRTDGLTTRWTAYRDVGRTEVTSVKERFMHRADLLQERELHPADSRSSDRFHPGKIFHLLSFTCRPQGSGEEQEMEFSSAWRTDRLRRRLLTPHQICETFEGRGDFLYCRQVAFSQPFDVREHALDFDVPLKEVVERFHRNESLPANRDVARRVFAVSERYVQLTHHLMESRVVPSRTYIHLDSAERRPFGEIYKNLQTPTRLTLLNEECELKSKVFQSLAETIAIIQLREQEERQQDKLLPETPP